MRVESQNPEPPRRRFLGAVVEFFSPTNLGSALKRSVTNTASALSPWTPDGSPRFTRGQFLKGTALAGVGALAVGGSIGVYCRRKQNIEKLRVKQFSFQFLLFQRNTDLITVAAFLDQKDLFLSEDDKQTCKELVNRILLYRTEAIVKAQILLDGSNTLINPGEDTKDQETLRRTQEMRKFLFEEVKYNNDEYIDECEEVFALIRKNFKANKKLNELPDTEKKELLDLVEGFNNLNLLTSEFFNRFVVEVDEYRNSILRGVSPEYSDMTLYSSERLNELREHFGTHTPLELAA